MSFGQFTFVPFFLSSFFQPCGNIKEVDRPRHCKRMLRFLLRKNEPSVLPRQLFCLSPFEGPNKGKGLAQILSKGDVQSLNSSRVIRKPVARCFQEAILVGQVKNISTSNGQFISLPTATTTGIYVAIHCFTFLPFGVSFDFLNIVTCRSESGRDRIRPSVPVHPIK